MEYHCIHRLYYKNLMSWKKCRQAIVVREECFVTFVMVIMSKLTLYSNGTRHFM